MFSLYRTRTINQAHDLLSVNWIIQSAVQIFIQAYHIVLKQSILFPTTMQMQSILKPLGAAWCADQNKATTGHLV